MRVNDHTEEPLTGGNMTPGLVKVGNTVRRPVGPWTPAVHALLVHLSEVGYEASPRSLGIDEQGRHVVEWIEGDVHEPYLLRTTDVGTVGRLIRLFHDAVESFEPPEDARWNSLIEPDKRTMIVHHDLAPGNFVTGGSRSVFIDWDLAAPGSRLWDLTWAAHGFLPTDGSVPLEAVARRLAALVDGYRLDTEDRRTLVDLLPARSRAMFNFLQLGHRQRLEPWARLWVEGHGRAWSRRTSFVERHREDFRRALEASA